MKRSGTAAGITLIEMIIVLALVGLITAIAFPAVTSGLDSVRLSSASDSIVSFLNAGLNRAERGKRRSRSVISIAENKIKIMAADTTRELAMPESISHRQDSSCDSVGTEEQARSIVLYPNGAIPRFGVEIASSKGTRRIVRVDPITGVPQVENVRMSRRTRAVGFTLLEVLVATVILAVAIAGLMSALSGSLRVAGRLTDYDRAAMLARRKMEEIIAEQAHAAQHGSAGRVRSRRRRTARRRDGESVSLPSRFLRIRRREMPIVDRFEVQVWWMNGERRAHV